VDNLRVGTDKINDDIQDIISSCKVSYSVDGVSQVTIILDDPDLEYMSRGYFYTGQHVTFHGEVFEMASVEIGPGNSRAQITVEARSFAMQKLKRDRKPIVVINKSPTQYAYEKAIDMGIQFFGQGTFDKDALTQVVNATSDESAWDVIKREAGQYQFWTFESAGQLFFTSQLYLLDKYTIGDGIDLHWPPDETKAEFLFSEMPKCRQSDDDWYGATMSAKIQKPDGMRLRPGMTVKLHGIPEFSMSYLVSDVTWDEDTPEPVDVSFRTPERPKRRDASGNLIDAAGNVIDEKGNLLGIAPDLGFAADAPAPRLTP
jgi:hypothetical protein